MMCTELQWCVRATSATNIVNFDTYIYIYIYFDNICPWCVEYVDSSVFLPIVTALEERIQSSGVGLRGASSC